MHQSFRGAALALAVLALFCSPALLAKDKGAGHGKDKDKGKGNAHAHAGGPPGHAAVHSLDIPPGHLPPPGSCRIWTPGVPPGHQSAPGPCRRLERRLKSGDWLVYRAKREPDLVYVDVPDVARPRAVQEVRVFQAGTGIFVRLDDDSRHAYRIH